MNYNDLWNEWGVYFAKLPGLLLALAVLLIGWLVVKVIANVLEKILRKVKVDQKFFSEKNDSTFSLAKVISKVVYYILLVFVFIVFFNLLNLDFIAAPLIDMLSGITAAVPNILKAALILLFGWIIASILKVIVQKLGEAFKVDAIFQRIKITKSKEESSKLIENAAKVVFYLVLFIFLPGVLSALNITGIAEPFSGVLDSLFAFVPKLLASVLIVLVGWVIAKIIRDIVTNFLQSIGMEKLTDRFGLAKLLEGTSISAVIGTILYVLILIPVVIAALDQLDINGISQPAIEMLNTILTMLPNIVVALILTIVGLWIGKWVASFVQGLLSRLGFDSLLAHMGIGKYDPSQSKVSLSQIAGYLVQVVIVLLFVVEALQVVQLHFLVTLATGVITYLPSLFAAIVIVAVGLYVGNLVKKVVSSVLQGNEFKLLSSIAKYTIIALSFFMALDQLGVAATIVNSAFVLILGGFALAFGLSFGLGGKKVASKYLDKFEEKVGNSSNGNEPE